jgi:NAD-dependent dihydropyrimidine dehydrogenase PreA subunit
MKAISNFLPIIDTAKCIGCKLCVQVCPHHVWSLIDNMAALTDPEACNYTGACQEICPTEAISLIYEIVFSKEREK